MSMFSLRSVKRRDHENWNMGVVHAVITDTAKKGATQGSHTTGAHNNNICIFIICQFTDHFSRSVAFFLVQLELQLQKKKKKKKERKKQLELQTELTYFATSHQQKCQGSNVALCTLPGHIIFTKTGS